MADDGVRALGECVRIGLNLPGKAPLQPFRGKLNRGQRILDLMRDTARDIGPGRLALGRLQFGDVVKRHHEPVGTPAGQFGANTNQQGAALVDRPDLNFRRPRAVGAVGHIDEKQRKFRHDIGQRMPNGRKQIKPQQFVGGPVRQLDPPLRVQSNNPG